MTLADIMVLVGASALGLALARSVLKTEAGWWGIVYPKAVGSPLLANWTVALLALRLKNPRPPIRRVFRQPGAAASLAGSVTILVWAGIIGPSLLFNDWRLPMNAIANSGVGVGAAVLGAWALLIATRTGRFEAGWIDRSGLALGAGWFILMIVVLIDAFYQ